MFPSKSGKMKSEGSMEPAGRALMCAKGAIAGGGGAGGWTALKLGSSLAMVIMLAAPAGVGGGGILVPMYLAIGALICICTSFSTGQKYLMFV